MKTLLREAGREFLKAFGASLVVLLPGVLAAVNVAEVNLDQIYAVGVAAFGSSLVAGFKALQVFVPSLTFAGLVRQPVAAWLDAFTRGFLGFFLVFWIDFMNEPDFALWKSALAGAVIGAFTAGARALEGLATKGEYPLRNVGLER